MLFLDCYLLESPTRGYGEPAGCSHVREGRFCAGLVLARSLALLRVKWHEQPLGVLPHWPVEE